MIISINNEPVKLTKKIAIQYHRKMWNWIADQYLKGRNVDHYYLKNEFINKYKIDGLILKCFCCTYTKDDIGDMHCESCPVKWYKYERIKNEGRCEDGCSPYGKLKTVGSPIEKEKYAREIANLEMR